MIDAEKPKQPRREQLDEVLPVVYQQLREIAHRQLAARGANGTLETTGLVHEAYLKLADQATGKWQDRAHFFAVASLAMRHVLVDRAKARRAAKRGGERRQVTLDENAAVVDDAEIFLEMVDALDQLLAIEPRLARVVELRFFGGLAEDEIAATLGISRRTVERDWMKARMLLARILTS